MEIWRDIKGFEGFYQVSSLGNVKSLDRKAFNGKVWHDFKGRIMSPVTHMKGYLKVRLQKNGEKSKGFFVHRLVLDAFTLNHFNYDQVNHINGIKTDNRLFNLEWCNNSMNQKHKHTLKNKANDNIIHAPRVGAISD
jgi:hypothetical protein